MAANEVNNPASLPPYSEMILAAIDNLNEKDGSNQTAISNYIEENYGKLLPDSHSVLLTDNLSLMKDNRVLDLLNNNYIRAPAKRKRGRPPKPKEALVVKDCYVGPPRPRGRPRKERDPLLVARPKHISAADPKVVFVPTDPELPRPWLEVQPMDAAPSSESIYEEATAALEQRPQIWKILGDPFE